MKVNVDIVGPLERKIRVELPADAVDQEFASVYGSLGRTAKVKGFRPGKVPRTVLQKFYGDEVKAEVLSRLVSNSLREAFKEKGLRAVSRPKVEVDAPEEGRGFAFSALVEVKPEIQVKKYLGLKVEKMMVPVTDAEVDTALKQLQESHAHLEPVENRNTVEKGDFVLLDFRGSIDGKPFPGNRGENFLMEVGEGRVLPEFEEAIVGLKKNGPHTVHLTYPQDYPNKNLAGKAAVFSLTVREIKKKVLPNLDDDFAKDYGGSASLEELRGNIRDRLGRELEALQQREMKEQIIRRLVESHPLDVPQAMLDQEIRYLMDRQNRAFAAQGGVIPQDRSQTEERRKKLEPEALKQVRAALLVEKIAALEGIEVSSSEMEKKIDELARAARERGAAVREFYQREEAREDLRGRMVFDRTLDFLLERANVREVDAQPSKKG